jgi:hypothetical protein
MPLPALPFNIGSIDFPMLSKNSCNKLPRSGLHLLCRQLGPELGGRQIADGRVQALLVIAPVVTLKPAICGQFKTDHKDGPKT